MRICMTIVLTVMAVWLRATPYYRTQLLQQIAQKAGIVVPDTTDPGTTIDSVSTVRKHNVRLRIDGFGDVAHIGYSLFSPSLLGVNLKSATFNSRAYLSTF